MSLVLLIDYIECMTNQQLKFSVNDFLNDICTLTLSFSYNIVRLVFHNHPGGQCK